MANHAGALCLPKPMTKEQSDAEDFLVRAMGLHDLITSLGDAPSSSRMKTILQQVQEDISTYSQAAHGPVPPGGDAGPSAQVALTRSQMQQMQDAAWMHSGAAQANVTIREFSHRLSASPVTTDAQNVYADINGIGTGLQVDKLIKDLQVFLRDIEVIVAPVNTLVGYGMADGGVPDLQTGAGAVMRYLGPTLDAIKDALSRVNAFLDPSAISKLRNDLTMLSRQRGLLGKDGHPGMCLESPREQSATH